VDLSSTRTLWTLSFPFLRSLRPDCPDPRGALLHQHQHHHISTSLLALNVVATTPLFTFLNFSNPPGHTHSGNSNSFSCRPGPLAPLRDLPQTLPRPLTPATLRIRPLARHPHGNARLPLAGIDPRTPRISQLPRHLLEANDSEPRPLTPLLQLASLQLLLAEPLVVVQPCHNQGELHD
jgi:hypothetical protein